MAESLNAAKSLLEQTCPYDDLNGPEIVDVCESLLHADSTIAERDKTIARLREALDTFLECNHFAAVILESCVKCDAALDAAKGEKPHE